MVRENQPLPPSVQELVMTYIDALMRQEDDEFENAYPANNSGFIGNIYLFLVNRARV